MFVLSVNKVTFNWGKNHKDWQATPPRGGEDNYDRYMSHDWERVFIESHGPAIRRCKVCGYLNHGFGEDRIPSCEEYKMESALE